MKIYNNNILIGTQNNYIPSLVVLFCFVLTGTTLSQKANVTKISYMCKTELKNGHIFDGRTSLYFSGLESIFVHEDVSEDNTYINSDNVTIFKKGDSEGFPVYINSNKKSLYYKSIYGSPRELFIFKEDIPKINWHITEQTKMLGHLVCVKAYGTFGGRTYDVWFTPDIPVSLGPYKLGGLPGLIVDAKSRDGVVSYDFLGIQLNCNDYPSISKPQVGKEVTWAEFKEYIISKLIRVEAMSTNSCVITNNDPPADYTIEKSKFVIITPYKNQRRERD